MRSSLGARSQWLLSDWGWWLRFESFTYPKTPPRPQGHQAWKSNPSLADTNHERKRDAMTAWSFYLLAVAFSRGTSVFGRFGSLPNSAWALISSGPFYDNHPLPVDYLWFSYHFNFLDPVSWILHLDTGPPNRRGEGPIGADIKNGLTTLLESIDERGLSIVTR